MCGSTKINGDEKRPSGGMRLSIVQSRKSGDAEKPGRMVAASHLNW